jgi:hypothetical protein
VLIDSARATNSFVGMDLASLYLIPAVSERRAGEPGGSRQEAQAILIPVEIFWIHARALREERIFLRQNSDEESCWAILHLLQSADPATSAMRVCVLAEKRARARTFVSVEPSLSIGTNKTYFCRGDGNTKGDCSLWAGKNCTSVFASQGLSRF